MTKRQLFEKYYQMACHNLLCYSQNYLMTIPKPGYEKEWEEAKQECDLLESMLAELQ
jgi:hypothetical protein